MDDVEKSLVENFEIAVEAMFELDSFCRNTQILFEKVLDEQ